MSGESPAHPAATVALPRDSDAGTEVLLVRRNSKLAFHGGAWVFPGGRIDPEDRDAAPTDDVRDAARFAAVREAFEEAGIRVEVSRLVLFSRWVTPSGLPKRFDAWFFAAEAPRADVRVDGDEIEEHRWMRPGDALVAHQFGEIELPPPTFVTLTTFRDQRPVAEILARLRDEPLRSYVPRLHLLTGGGACSLYEGDAGYDAGDPERAGPRHRLTMHEGGSWSYECTVDGLRFDLP
mgnify:CR=1 FL=1